MVASFKIKFMYDVHLRIWALINLLKKMKHVKVNSINCPLSIKLAWRHCRLRQDNACENEQILDQILCNAFFRTFFEPLFFSHSNSGMAQTLYA